MKRIKTDWSEQDFDKVDELVRNYFCGKTLLNHRGERVSNVHDRLCLAYTSSGIWAQESLDLNELFYHPSEDGMIYDCVIVDERGEVYLVLRDNESIKEMFIQL